MCHPHIPHLRLISPPSCSYLEAQTIIRAITSLDAGNGPYINIHDGFHTWARFLPGSDRVVLDTHPYFAFNQDPEDVPIAQWPAQACRAWGRR